MCAQCRHAFMWRDFRRNGSHLLLSNFIVYTYILLSIGLKHKVLSGVTPGIAVFYSLLFTDRACCGVLAVCIWCEAVVPHPYSTCQVFSFSTQLV